MKRGLQIALGILSLIPILLAVQNIGGGAAGLAGEPVSAALDNQFRYLSAFYLSLSFLIWWAIPNIERHTAMVCILVGCVFLGGLARLYSYMTLGHPGADLFGGMVLEFVLIGLIPWQLAVAKRAARS